MIGGSRNKKNNSKKQDRKLSLANGDTSEKFIKKCYQKDGRDGRKGRTIKAWSMTESM